MSFLSDLDTPCVVVDMEKVRENILAMQKAVSACNCKLRPHIKTHKTIKLAKMQVEAGACGITCAKVSEAEVMANGGLDDIFIAYPLVTERKMRQAAALQRKVKRLILAVDSIEGASLMSQIAQNENITFEARLEVDTGAKRTGAVRENAVALGLEISKLPNLNLTGIYTFKSMLYQNKTTTDAALAGREEGELMGGIAQALAANRLNITDISAGSTPTGVSCANTGLVNEVRPGTYIYHDIMTMKENACQFSNIAAYIYCTVVSVPTGEYAVIDGGSKTFPTDAALNTDPFYFHSYGYVVGRDDLRLTRLNEEHGIITSVNGSVNLKVGDILALVPTHVCTAINLQNNVYLLDGGKIQKMPVDARGMLF